MPCPPAPLWQTVLKFTDARVLQDLIAPVTLIALPEFQRLIAVIQTLRGADPLNAPTTLTPTTLLPYVSEEALDLQDCLKAMPTVAASMRAAYLTLDDLIAPLLWTLARTSYPVMRLIEGIAVQYQTPGGPDQRSGPSWATGVLRLVMMLRTPIAPLTFDLVTQAPADALLCASAQVISADLPWVQGDSQTVLDRILADLHDTTLNPFLVGLPVEWLTPGQSWQTGQFQLQLGWELLAIAPMPLNEAAPRPALGPASASSAPWPWPLQPGLLIRRAAAGQLGPPYPLPLLRDWQHKMWTDPAADLLLPIVQVAWDAAVAIAPAESAPELFSDEFMPWLLWQVARGHYDIMCLLGGVAATVMPPNAPWQPGTLRLVPKLDWIAPDCQWTIDLTTRQLATGQLAKEQLAKEQLASGLRLPSGSLCQTAATTPWIDPSQAAILEGGIISTAALSARIEQSLAAVPELAALCSGLAIAGLVDQSDWHPAHLRLWTELEFTPEPPEIDA